MLKTTATNLMAEIDAAITYRDDHLDGYEEKIARYTGPQYDQAGSGHQEYSPENTYYEYVSLMVPRLVFDNPRVQVQSRRAGAQRDVALAMRHGLNRWARDISLRKILAELATDMLMGWGVALRRPDHKEAQAYATKTPYAPAETEGWPTCERISPRKFFADPKAERFASCRFTGHTWHIDKDDLIDLAMKNDKQGWNLEAIEDLSSGRDPSRVGTDIHTPYRNEVYCYEIYIPEIELDDSPGPKKGFHGTIYTLGVNQALGGFDEDSAKGGFIREPRPFYGPASGPYVMFGAYKVPNAIYPLAPLVAVDTQIKDLNDQVLAVSASMLKHKRVVGVNDQRTAKILKDTQHDFVAVVPFEDGKAMVQEFMLGGQSDQQANWIATCRQRTDRTLGMDEAMRGGVSGVGTATEHSIASEASNTRMAFVKQSFTDATIDLLRGIAFYMYHDDSIVFPVGREAVEELGMDPGTELMFQGGGDEDSAYSFEDLELEIEPYSMERASEGLAQKRALEMHSMLLNSLQLMQQYPDYPWKDHFGKVGNAMNAPDMSELIDEAFLGRLAEDLSMQRQMETLQAAASMDPRLEKDAGKGGASLGSAPSKRVPMAGQAMAQMLQAVQQQGQTAPPPGVNGVSSS